MTFHFPFIFDNFLHLLCDWKNNLLSLHKNTLRNRDLGNKQTATINLHLSYDTNYCMHVRLQMGTEKQKKQ